MLSDILVREDVAVPDNFNRSDGVVGLSLETQLTGRNPTSMKLL